MYNLTRIREWQKEMLANVEYDLEKLEKRKTELMIKRVEVLRSIKQTDSMIEEEEETWDKLG